jgi:hypothetical protein
LSPDQVAINGLVICQFNERSKKVATPCLITDIRQKYKLAYVIPIGGESGWWARFDQLKEYQNGEWE